MVIIVVVSVSIVSILIGRYEISNYSQIIRLITKWNEWFNSFIRKKYLAVNLFKIEFFYYIHYYLIYLILNLYLMVNVTWPDVLMKLCTKFLSWIEWCWSIRDSNRRAIHIYNKPVCIITVSIQGSLIA